MLRKILVSLFCVSVFLPFLGSCGSPVDSLVQDNWKKQENPGGQDPSGETSDPDQSGPEDPDNAGDPEDADDGDEPGNLGDPDDGGGSDAGEGQGAGPKAGDQPTGGESPGTVEQPGSGEGGADNPGAGEEPGSGGSPGDGVGQDEEEGLVAVTNVAALQEYLDGQPENGPENPYPVKVSGINLAGKGEGNALKGLYLALSRYVALDLSGSYGKSFANVSVDNVSDKGKITAIILPSGLTTIEKNAFEKCGELVLAHLNEVTTIEHGAFSRCSKLEILIMEEVKKIEYTSKSANGAFHNCDALTSVSLPKAEKIGTLTFNSCDALSTVHAPLVTEIGDKAFAECKNLAYLTLGETPPALGDSVFADNKPETIYVPASSVNTYKTTTVTGWTDSLKAKIQAIP
jgi:hypothetical protein